LEARFRGNSRNRPGRGPRNTLQRERAPRRCRREARSHRPAKKRAAGEGVRTGGPLRSLTQATGRPKSRHRGSGPPLLGSTCPTEFLPIRVAGHRFPAPPLPFPLSRWAPGSFPVRPHRHSEERRRPLLGFGLPTGFPTGHSDRPVSGPVPPLGFFAPTTVSHTRIRSTRACLTRHLPTSGFETLTPVCSPRALPVRRPAPPLGFTLQGFAPSSRPRPFPGPYPHAVSRLSLPSPLRTRRSGAPPRLQGFTPTGEPCSSGGSKLPSEPLPSWVATPSEALAPPRWSRLPGPSPLALSHPAGRSQPDGGAPGSRSAARSGELSRARRLPWGLSPRPALRLPPGGGRFRAAVGASPEQPSPTATARLPARRDPSIGPERGCRGRIVDNPRDPKYRL
jgi:hypothetical protein